MRNDRDGRMARWAPGARRVTIAMVTAIVAACSTSTPGEPSALSAPTTTATEPSAPAPEPTPAPTTAATEPTSPATDPTSTSSPSTETTATPDTTTPATAAVPADGLFAATLPDHVRFGDDGLFTVIGGVETQVVTVPVASAWSDSAGGYLYRTADRTMWQPATTGGEPADPVEIEDWGWTASAGDGTPSMLVDRFDATEGCEGDGAYQTRLLRLDTGESELIGCSESIGDGYTGLFDHQAGRTVVRGEAGYANIGASYYLAVVGPDDTRFEIPGLPLDDHRCDACTMQALLSPDGGHVATWFRDDFSYVGDHDPNIEDPVAWNERLDTDPGELRVTNLDTGATRYRAPVPARSELADFDGRFAVIAPILDSTAPALLIDTTGAQPPVEVDGEIVLLRPPSGGVGIAVEPVPLAPDAIGPWVAYLQQRLVDAGADIEVDGRFGPGTEAAVVAIQDRSGLPTTGRVDEATWSVIA